MALPRAVQRQGDRAEQIRKKVYEEGKTPAELGVKADPPPGEAPNQGEKPALAISPDRAEPPPEIDYKVEYEKARQELRTVKGKLDSEVPELIAVNREMAGQIASLQGTVSELQTKVNKPAEEPAGKVDPQESQDLQAYQDTYPEIHRGQLIVLKQWVKSEEFKGMVSSIVEDIVTRRVEPRVASVEQEVKTTKDESFQNKMDRLVKDENGNPCWRQINDEKEFGPWLRSRKRGGYTDFDLLRGALQKGDAEAVADYFVDYMKAKHPAAAPPADKGGNGKPVVEDEALAPARPGGGGSPRKDDAGDKPRTFTRSEVKKYHTDVALGRYKNRPKDRERIKAEIDEAMTNGLITEG